MRPLYLALSGGGAHAAAHCGVLLALERAGLPVAGVSAVSGASLVAAAWAGGADMTRFVEQASGIRIGFLEWMAIGVPAMLAFLPLAWLLNTTVLFPSGMAEIEGGREYVRDEWAKLGPLNPGERVTLAVFAL